MNEFDKYMSGYKIVQVRGYWRSKPKKRKKNRKKKSLSSALNEVNLILEEGW